MENIKNMTIFNLEFFLIDFVYHNAAKHFQTLTLKFLFSIILMFLKLVYQNLFVVVVFYNVLANVEILNVRERRVKAPYLIVAS